jgi:hypothetical protein
VTQGAADFEGEFAVGVVFESFGGDDERVGRPDAEHHDRDRLRFADEDGRYRKAEHLRATAHHREGARVLHLVDADRRAEEPPARQREIDHRAGGKERHLREPDVLV